MSEKIIKKCPWCEDTNISVKTNILQSSNSNVVERRCGACNKVLAAYAEGEKDFLPKIRVF